MKAQMNYETTQHDNFLFLKEGLEELYLQAVLAERYFESDPQSSLAKMRLFVEIACHELGQHFSLRPPVHGDLANKIKMLDASQCLDDWVIDAMTTLRLEGNRSVHMTEVNGNFIAKLEVSSYRMRQHMQSMHEIACYVAEKVLKIEHKALTPWELPQGCELSEQVTSALKGNRNASFFLASRYFDELTAMAEKKGDNRWWSKNQYMDRQADLSYWLEKAHKQGHTESWLLFAKCYANRLLVEVGERDAKFCFKKALKEDVEGNVAFEFGRYLQDHEEGKLGLTYIERAAKEGHQEALNFMLSETVKTDGYASWLALALDHKVLEAFTCDAVLKLDKYLSDKSELNKKQLRSAVVNAESRRAPGIKFVKAYTDFHILEKMSDDAATIMMVDAYQSLPTHLWFEHKLFTQISGVFEHYELLTEMYHKALYQIEGDKEAEAEVKYAIVKGALEQFKEKKQVKTPASIPDLLKEAADAGHTEARMFANSSEGKAILKRLGFNTIGNHKKSAVTKDKQKRKRKQLKKAKRK